MYMWLMHYFLHWTIWVSTEHINSKVGSGNVHPKLLIHLHCCCHSHRMISLAFYTFPWSLILQHSKHDKMHDKTSKR